MEFTQLDRAIRPLDTRAMEQARQRLNSIAKPVGSLGLLEDAVIRLAGIQRTADVVIDRRAVVVMCADNGVLKQGVAQTPGEITAVMSGVIAARRSSVCIMADYAHADVLPVDIGVAKRMHCPGMLDRHIADGTADMTAGPAMTHADAMRALETGIAVVRDCRAQGYRLLATGEMGIGNTTTSSAVASVLLNRSVAEMTGRGAGLSEEGLERKTAAITRAIEINRPEPADALDVVSKIGGFDIAGLAGVCIGGAQYGVPILIDGFISAVSALVAVLLCPAVQPYLLASHASAEPASRAVLEALSLSPVIHAGMRLGEGTGAVAMLPLLDMTLRVYNELLTYADIGM